MASDTVSCHGYHDTRRRGKEAAPFPTPTPSRAGPAAERSPDVHAHDAPPPGRRSPQALLEDLSQVLRLTMTPDELVEKMNAPL